MRKLAHAALCAAAAGACAAPLDPIEDGLAVEVPERYASAREGAFEGVPWDGPWWHAAVQDAELAALVARCLDVGGSVQDLVIEDNTAAGARIPVRQGQVYSLGPSLSWELDLFGRIDATQDAAALGAEASEADVHALRRTLTGSGYEAWLDAVENRALEALGWQRHGAEQPPAGAPARVDPGRAPRPARSARARVVPAVGPGR